MRIANVGDVFNIGNDDETTIEDLALRVIKLTESSSKINRVSYETAYNPGFEDMQRRVPDITKIKKTVGWAPEYSLDAIITDVADHLR